MDIRQNATSEINGRTSMSLPWPPRGPRRRFLIRRPLLRSCVGHAPNRPTSVVGNQQRPVFHYCQRSGASPHLGTMLTRHPEAGHEILVASVRSAVFEPYPNNFIARRLRAVPGALKRHECIPAILCRELAAVVEYHVQDRRVRLEQHVRDNCCFDFVRRPMCKARLRVGTDIGVGPTVKRTLLDASEVIGRKIVAKPVTLLNSCVELSSSRVECEGRRIAHSRGKRGLAGAVRFEPLN